MEIDLAPIVFALAGAIGGRHEDAEIPDISRHVPVKILLDPRGVWSGVLVSGDLREVRVQLYTLELEKKYK